MAVRKGWTHECKVWALGRFTEVTVDEPEVQGEGKVGAEFWSYLRFAGIFFQA